VSYLAVHRLRSRLALRSLDDLAKLIRDQPPPLVLCPESRQLFKSEQKLLVVDSPEKPLSGRKRFEPQIRRFFRAKSEII
jgi:hypothetical protein